MPDSFRLSTLAIDLSNRNSPNSNVKLIQVDDELQLRKFIKKNVFGKKIYIGMGAGSISNWMKNLENIF